MTEVRYLHIDEILAISRAANGTDHSVRDMGLPVSAIGRPRTHMFGAELYPTLHRKAAALLHAVARNHALIDGNKPTAWLATRTFLRFNGLSPSTLPPPASIAGPFVEDVAQDLLDVPTIAKRLEAWFPAQGPEASRPDASTTTTSGAGRLRTSTPCLKTPLSASSWSATAHDEPHPVPPPSAPLGMGLTGLTGLTGLAISAVRQGGPCELLSEWIERDVSFADPDHRPSPIAGRGELPRRRETR